MILPAYIRVGWDDGTGALWVGFGRCWRGAQNLELTVWVSVNPFARIVEICGIRSKFHELPCPDFIFHSVFATLRAGGERSDYFPVRHFQE
jgi:hypothetical protein